MTVTGRHRQATPISLHQGDVGHVGVIGATGNGKSTLLNFCCFQWSRYPGAEGVIFDKGGAARIVTAALGGSWYDLGRTALQPLAHIHTQEDRTWALDWLDSLLDLERLQMTPEQKGQLYRALQVLSTLPAGQRTLTKLREMVEDMAVKQALLAYTMAGPYGHWLDGSQDAIADNPWLCFELEVLLETPKALNAVLPALFHRLQKRLTGVPVRYFLHEGWMAFDTPYWADRLRACLKGFRVKNASVILATQSLADAVDSKIHAALVDNIPLWLYTANEKATNPGVKEYYIKLGLNDRELTRLAHATAKQDYYLKAPNHTCLFQLDLGPTALALCQTPGPQALVRIRDLSTTYGDPQWLEHYAYDESHPCENHGSDQATLL